MPIETISGVPSTFTSGDTVRFKIVDATHPAPGWTLAFTLRGPNSLLTVTATVTNVVDHLVTLTAVQTAALFPGDYSTGQVFTETLSSDKISFSGAHIRVSPNLADTSTGPRRAAYILARTAYESLAASKFSTVSFNGQSFSRQTASDLMKIVDRLHMDALREDKERGLAQSGGLVRVVTRM